MTANHLEFLVEEPSMEAFLDALLPRILPANRTFIVHPFQGKTDLFQQLPSRLRAYRKWLPSDWRIVVVVDRDTEDCRTLKHRMDTIARNAGFAKKRYADWQLINRIAIEELEAWYFGDWEAVRTIYPRAPMTIPFKAQFRDSDAIIGGTSEAFERILRQVGYFTTGLRKTEAARAIGSVLDPSRCTSRSFMKFRETIAEAVT